LKQNTGVNSLLSNESKEWRGLLLQHFWRPHPWSIVSEQRCNL
jgi:hypothetical protein